VIAKAVSALVREPPPIMCKTVGTMTVATIIIGRRVGTA
jgi:hypothetical protein